jgi:hypothetical protein
VRSAEALGRVRLSASFFMRDFLHSEIAAIYGMANMPDDPDLAIAAGWPLRASAGAVAGDVRSAGHPVRLPFARSQRLRQRAFSQLRLQREKSGTPHLGSAQRDGGMGAVTSIVIPWLVDRLDRGVTWQSMAWWIHDHLPYSELQFFPKLAAFKIGWHERPRRRISSFAPPRGVLTKPGLANHGGDHSEWYRGFPALAGRSGISPGYPTVLGYSAQRRSRGAAVMDATPKSRRYRST